MPLLPSAAAVGTTMVDDGLDSGAAATAGTEARSGEEDGSELGGEPTSDGLTLKRVPQLKLPGSVGGVTRGTMRAALAGSRSSAPSNWQTLARGGLSAWRGSSGFDRGPAPSEKDGLEFRGTWSGCGAAMPN